MGNDIVNDMSKLYYTDVNYNVFIKVELDSNIVEVILVMGYNLKYIYKYLKERGCLKYPPERQSYGQIWAYNPNTKECKAYSKDEYENILYNRK